MSVEHLSKQLKLLQEELACMRAAEQHIQDKIDLLLTELNDKLECESEHHEESTLGDLNTMLRKFEIEHPELTDSINRVFVTLGNMGI